MSMNMLKCEPYTCSICGAREEAEYLDNFRMIKKKLCFSCNFWDEWYETDKTDVNSLVCKGVHYHIGSDQAPQMCRGFGGQKFTILFNDGRVVETRNLWCQGNIPKIWIDKFPDTATMKEV